MKIFLTLSVLLLANFLSGQQMSGIVMTSEPGSHPISDARLNFVDLGIIIRTDNNGEWQLEGAKKGNYRVEISAYGYGTELFEITYSEERFIFYLTENHRELDKLIVTHNGVLQNQSITAIESLQLNDPNVLPTASLGEAISAIPGVYQTGIGIGVSKPVIRGLSGSSIVTYVNSLRIENQQWGGDHGLPITGLGIGSVEVIKGPASLLYGADAMGGVLYFVDESYAALNSSQINLQTKFDSNTMGTSNQGGFKISTKKLRLNIFGAYDNYADYQLPNKAYVTNSRFNQSAAKMALGYSKNKWVINLRYNFYHGRIGLPGHTHDLEVTPLAFQSSDQKRKDNIPAQLVTNHFIALEQKLFLARHELHLTLGHTRNGLNEFEEKFSIPAIVMQLNNTLYNAKWRFKLTEKMDLFVGSQGMMQQNRNGIDAPEMLIPNAITTDIGAFGLFTYRQNLWRFQIGSRMDSRSISTQDEWMGSDFNRNFNGYNYSVGAARLSPESSLRFNVSSGFRAPTSSELLSDGVHHGAFRYERGDRNLNTEKAMQIDLSYAFHFDDLELIFNPFYNRIRDYVYLRNTGEVQEDFLVYQYDQVEFAQLYGADFGFHYHPHGAHWLHIESSFSTVFAEDEFKNPLPLIPQTRFNNQLRFDFASKGKVHFQNILIQYLYFFKQNRLGLLESLTGDYHIINLGANLKIEGNVPFIVSFGVRNLLNASYIDHLSGLKSLGLMNPGMNAYVSINMSLNNSLKSK